MNLLANKTFRETLKIYDGDNANVEKINRYIKKSLNFYNRNNDDVTKNDLKNRFDNVTFKTIKHIRKHNNGEFDKWKNNLEEVKNSNILDNKAFL